MTDKELESLKIQALEVGDVKATLELSDYYIEMEKPGILKIITPIVWSPSEKSWLKWWDIITKIDGWEIWKITTVNEAVSKIKTNICR